MDINNIDAKKSELALKTASKEVSSMALQMKLLVEEKEKEFKGILPMAETQNDYDFCKKVRADLMPMRSALEAARKTLKAPILEAGKLVDETLKPLAERVRDIYEPFETAYREVDKRKEVRKQARLKKISDGFELLNGAITKAVGQSSEVITAIIEDLADFDLDPAVFMEQTDTAAATHGETMEKLSAMLIQQLKIEEFDEREKAMAKREAEMEAINAAEKKRIADEIFAKEEAEQNAKREAELKQAREEAAELARINAKAAHEEELRQAAQAQAEAVEKAKADELARINQEKAQADADAKRREENKAHFAKVNRAVLTEILKTGITEKQGKAIITMVAKKEAATMYIKY